MTRAEVQWLAPSGVGGDVLRQVAHRAVPSGIRERWGKQHYLQIMLEHPDSFHGLNFPKVFRSPDNSDSAGLTVIVFDARPNVYDVVCLFCRATEQ